MEGKEEVRGGYSRDVLLIIHHSAGEARDLLDEKKVGQIWPEF